MKNIVIKLWLRNYGYNIDFDDFSLSYQSHPEFPSIKSLSETLTSKGIKNIALKIEKESIYEIDEYALVHILYEKKNILF